MRYTLGVDGGNTKTIALVANLDGAIVGAGRGGCGDIYNAPFVGTNWSDAAAAAIANIEFAVESALQAAHATPSELQAGVFSMAGADWPEDFALLSSAMRARGYGRIIIVQNDAMGVLHAGVADNVGVSVVCGTGGATGARGPDGRTWHSSFWQDQAQGGEQMNYMALNAVVRAELGIDPPTMLKQRFLEYFEMESVEEVLHLFTRRGQRPSRRLNGITPLLLNEAQAGDVAARKIVQEHGNDLGDYARIAARFVGLEGTPFSLVLAGGVLRHPSTLLADTIIERVKFTSPDVRPTRSRFEPVIGALFAALEAAGLIIDDALLERMIPTLPASELFATWLE
ncbi:MAG TPA: BadF/BadG/BcrA/BcrD ATPase family protein [Ktedonobacteraceae bacterium]|nr:BadF/BadG/BcrA/BcrD ATPase family protein [Ktedonobacteraceae bacterium]